MSAKVNNENHYYKKGARDNQISVKTPKYDKAKVLQEISSVFKDSWPKIEFVNLPAVITKVMNQYDTLKRQHYERIQKNADKVVEIMISRFPMTFQFSFDMYYAKTHPDSNDYHSNEFKRSRLEAILKFLKDSRSSAQRAIARSSDDMINNTKDQATQTDDSLELAEIPIWRNEAFSKASFQKKRFVCNLLAVCLGCLELNCEGARSVSGECPTAPYCVICGMTHSSLLSCPTSA